jgi:hypothetical protein
MDAERDFWLTIRRALLMVKDKPQVAWARSALVMVVGAIEKRYGVTDAKDIISRR